MPPNGGDVALENREAYDSIEENRFFETLSQPQSTFAIDVDTASYSNVRRLIRSGVKPPKGAVRLEELVNYLAYGMLLRESQYVGKATWEWVISTAQSSTGKDPSGLRKEFVQLAMAVSQIE